MLYKRHPKEKKKHIYNILLKSLIDLQDSEKITK
jgi:hypothetical protein